VRSADLHQGVAADWSRLQADGPDARGNGRGERGQLLPVSEGHYEVGWHSAHDAFVAFSETTLGEQHPEDDLSDPRPARRRRRCGRGYPRHHPRPARAGSGTGRDRDRSDRAKPVGAEDDAGLRCRWGSLGDR